MLFSSLDTTDLHAIKDLQPEGWGDISDPIQAYLTKDYCHPIKISINNRIAGIGCTIIHDDTAWLGHIIVHPEFRNRGIGSQMTEKLIDIANNHHCKTIQLIATELGAPVYEKHGFRCNSVYQFFEETSSSSHQLISNDIITYTDTFKADLFDLDYQVSGENRTCELKEQLEGAYLFVRNNKLEGYYLPSWREGLIIAENKNAGTELMKLHLSTQNKIVLPEQNQDALHYLSRINLHPYSTAKRMYLGEKPPVKFEFIYNRIAGNIG